MKPLIGIAGTREDAPASSPFSGWKRIVTSEAYTSAVLNAGGIPVLLPVPYGPQAFPFGDLLGRCSAVLLPGGYDIDPTLYGERTTALCKKTDRTTDLFQIRLAREARRRGLPVLGICKGCQILAVMQGGSLYQDYSLQNRPMLKHDHMDNPTRPFHTVRLEPSSRTATLFGRDTLEVNSLHHQQIKAPGAGMKTAALCEDGGIEAIEAVSGPWCIGVQWHPEAMEMENTAMLPLFAGFVEQAAATVLP